MHNKSVSAFPLAGFSKGFSINAEYPPESVKSATLNPNPMVLDLKLHTISGNVPEHPVRMTYI